MALKLIDKDPTRMGFPSTLALELAMQTGTVPEILASYGISQDRWDELQNLPAFAAARDEADKLLAEEGGSFKMKARALADQLLGHAYDLIQDQDNDNPTPPAVKADLIKAIIKFAGLDASIEQKGAAAGKAIGNALQINFIMGKD